MQAEPIPYFAFLLLSSYTKCVVILDPEAARGCPNAMAPPFTFNLFMSNWRSLAQARVWAPKASFI